MLPLTIGTGAAQSKGSSRDGFQDIDNLDMSFYFLLHGFLYFYMKQPSRKGAYKNKIVWCRSITKVNQTFQIIPASN